MTALAQRTHRVCIYSSFRLESHWGVCQACPWTGAVWSTAWAADVEATRHAAEAERAAGEQREAA